MFCRSICWFICTFLAAVTATGYSGQVSSTGCDSEFAIHHLRANNQDSSTSGMGAELLTSADQYGSPALKADSEQQMAKQLSVETAAATAVLAVSHSYDTLKKASIDYIRTHIFDVMATQGWADAINTQPQVMIKVMQLLSQSPAETSSSTPGKSGSSLYHATQSQGDYSGHQTTTTATPTTVAQIITKVDDDHVTLLRSLPPEEKTRRLMQAARDGAVGELEALLVAGADVAARDEDMLRRTALHWAAGEGHEEAARRLLAAGAAVDAKVSPVQRTPLDFAASQGHTAVVRLLLENGADHGARDVMRSTPLHGAAFWGHREAAAALLEAGADRAATDFWGNTPLDYARLRNHQQVVALLGGSSPAAGTGRK